MDSETIEGIVSRGEEEGMLSRLQEQLGGPRTIAFNQCVESRYPETEGRYSATGNCDGSRSRSTNCDEAGAGTYL